VEHTSFSGEGERKGGRRSKERGKNQTKREIVEKRKKTSGGRKPKKKNQSRGPGTSILLSFLGWIERQRCGKRERRGPSFPDIKLRETPSTKRKVSLGQTAKENLLVLPSKSVSGPIRE